MHEEVAIDRRNGLRAGPGCPVEHVERRVFERYGPDLDAWARGVGRPMAPDAFSPLCPSTGDETPIDAPSGPLRITYPHDGARFVLDPERPRALSAVPLQVAVPPGVRKLTLRVDGVVTARLDPPFSTTWPIEPGDHTLSVEAPGGTPAAVVHVSVR
jgi:penicillin-binding protein 1C